MRKKIAVAVAVAGIGLSGLAVSVPAFAISTPGPSSTSGSTAAPSSPLDSLKSALSGLVKDKTLTQAQADKVATTLSTAGVGRGGPGGPGGHGGPGGGHGFGGDLSTAAKTLGVSEADLRTALQSGQTLAQVAKAHDVSVDTLVAALVKDEKARIAQAVTDGRFTQAEADKMLTDLSARVTERVDSTRPDHGGGRGPGGSGKAPSPTPTPSSSSSSSSTSSS